MSSIPDLGTSIIILFTEDIFKKNNLTQDTGHLELSHHAHPVGCIVLFLLFQHLLLKEMAVMLLFQCFFELYPTHRISPHTDNWLSYKISINLQNKGSQYTREKKAQPFVSQCWLHACSDFCLDCVADDYGSFQQSMAHRSEKNKRNFELQGEVMLKKATIY